MRPSMSSYNSDLRNTSHSVLGGIDIIPRRRRADGQSDLPLFSEAEESKTKPKSIFSFQFLRNSLKQILEGKESRRIFLYLCINLLFMFVEFFYGLWTNSLGLISDAFHMFFDSTALIIGLFASIVSQWKPNHTFSYGYGRVEVLSGFINGIFLLFVGGLVLKESLVRFFFPQEILTDKLLLVSFLGLCVNLIGIFAFHDLHGGGDDDDHGHSHGHSHSHDHSHSHSEKKEKKEKKSHSHSHDEHHNHDHHDHHDDHDEHHHHEKKKHEKKHKEEKGGNDSNVHGVYLHIIADTLGSVGVITSSFLIQQYGWISADPICSFCISILIFVSTIQGKVPKMLKSIRSLPGVSNVSDVHIWKHDKNTFVGSFQVSVRKDVIEQQVIQQVGQIFKEKGVQNVTVEIAYT